MERERGVMTPCRHGIHSSQAAGVLVTAIPLKISCVLPCEGIVQQRIYSDIFLCSS